MQKIWVTTFMLLLSLAALAQPRMIKGQVLHHRTRDPLPFVNISVMGTHRGMTSDVEGRFNLPLETEDHTLLFSYMGFETLRYTVPAGDDTSIILLKEKPTELNEIVIRAGENPAFRIIRQCNRNKSINDPEQLPSFSYHAYNKLILTSEGTNDSAKTKTEKDFRDFASKNNFFVGESYTVRNFVYPNWSKETVLGNQVSGVKDPFFSFLATDFQPFSFYKDFIFLFNKNFLNPVSEGSTNQYDFSLSDTLYHGIDTVFVISFHPLSGKAFDGLKGQLYINTNGYAIEHVLAQPADDQVIVAYHIQQKYQQINGHWFPVQLNAELRFTQYSVAGQKPVYISRSYLSDILIGEPIDKKEFGLLSVEYDPSANRKSPEYWRMHRTDSLSYKEANTYKFYDSLGPKLKAFNTIVKTAENLVVGRFKMGKFFLPLEYLGRINQFEGNRLGLGFQTGEQISKWWMLEGYVGYGFHDRASKYGAAIQFNFLRAHDAQVRFSWKQDVSEPGQLHFIRNPLAGNESIRRWLTSRMDSLLQYSASFTFHVRRYATFSCIVTQEKRTPTYPYSFHSMDDPLGLRRTFQVTELGIQYRLAWNETFVQIGSGKAVTKIVYPQVNLSLFRGIDSQQGQFSYTKAEARLDQQWVMRRWGVINLRIDAGKIWGSIPYPFLFNGRGTHDNMIQNSIYVPNFFQAMGLYEFSSEAYSYLFLSNHIGRITGMRSKHFRPELVLIHNAGVGSLSHPELHQGITFKTMNRGYLEGGLMLENIYRVNYLNLLYFGVGAGTFYRYGAYAFTRQEDNFTIKIVFTLSF